MIQLDDLRGRCTRVAWYRPLRPADERGERTDNRYGLLRIHDEPALEIISRAAFERLEQALEFADADNEKCAGSENKDDTKPTAIDPTGPGGGF